MRLSAIFIIAISLALMVNCKGGGSSKTRTSLPSSSSSNMSSSGTGSATPAARGELIKKPGASTFAATAVSLKTQLHNTLDGRMLLEAAGTPHCGIDVRYFQYGTVGAQGEPATASGAIMMPTGNSSDCTGPRPLVLYAHGTSLNRRYNLANMRDENNDAQGEAFFVATTFAAQGYIVVAPNYVGYDSSNLNYHPYLVADQQSKELMDALAAAKLAMQQISTNSSAGEKLFITGYSEGGHVAMATLRALEQAGISVTASAPLSGPYALAAQADAVFYGYVHQYSVYQSTLAIVAMQKSYGDIYTTPADFFAAPFASAIETLLPSNNLSASLRQLPATALFSTTPLNLSLANTTPPVAETEAYAMYEAAFGSDALIKNSAREVYLEDAIANPDGGFPNNTDGLPASAPSHPLRVAAIANDLRNFTPLSPIMLCAGNGDPQSYYLNTQLMADYWSELGEGRVTVLDVDSATTATDPYGDIKEYFAAIKASVAAQPDGVKKVFESYHSELVFAACLRASRSFFAQF